MNKDWKYGILDNAVKKGSSNISLNKIQQDEGPYPVFGAKGFMKNVSFYHQESDYLALIKDGAGIGRVSKHPAKSSVLATMQYIIPKEGYDIDFIRYFLEGLNFEDYRTGSTIPHIYYKDYKNVRFPLVGVNEQKQIVALLDQAFEVIGQAKANIEKNIENAKELFQSKLNDIFSQKGEGWEKKTLGEIAEFKNGLNFTKSSQGERMKLVGVSNFKNNFYVPLDKLEQVDIEGKLSELYELKNGDILTVRSNGNPKLIGRCILADGVTEKISHSGFTIRIRANQDKINGEYLCHYLKSSKAKNELINSGTGINIKSLNQGALSKLNINYPESLKSQEIVSNQISELSSYTNKIEAKFKSKLIQLEDLKKSILQKAFAGELTNKTVEV
jgi:type I restriction enzyme S subunit